jgi:NitT/TauT family transport system permease protein
MKTFWAAGFPMTASFSDPKTLRWLTGRLARIGAFAWSAWIGLAALCLIAAVWQWGHEAFGDFVLPSPLSVALRVSETLRTSESWPIAAATARRALIGLAISLAAGGVLGLVSGYSPAAMRLARPIISVLLGVPPIAWIVIVMIWFGSTDTTIIIAVVAAAAPLIFLGAAEGAAMRDRGLEDMARAFGAGPLSLVFGVGLRQASLSLFPVLIMALGTAFKVAVMSELLTNAGGVGGSLADARATLDVGAALAWVVIAVGLLFAFEYGLIQPVRSEVERWRAAAQPWGVKR